MKLTVTQAAKQWRMTRQTVYNRLKDGEMSCERDENGKRLIEHSEMVRVFGEPGQSKRGSKSEDRKMSPEELLIDTLKEQLSIANRRIDELKDTLKEKDAEILKLLRELQGDFTRFLEHQPERPAVIHLPSDSDVEKVTEPEVKQVEIAPEPKKKKSKLLRMIEAALD